MSAYLILLTLFAIAWAMIGFSVAMLLLKLRWNLVVSVLILAAGFGLPLVISSYALIESGHTWVRQLMDAYTIHGMLSLSFEVMIVVCSGTYMVGMLAGTITGLWPRTDDDGKRVRNTTAWKTWKLAAAGPIALAVTITLFFLADLRAQQRLAELRAKHQAILDVQEDVAPRLQNDAAQVHDALMLALLEDTSPDWVLADSRQAMTLPRSDYDLLKIFLPGFQDTSGVLAYAQRHEAKYYELRDSVLTEGLEYRHWDQQVARFAAVHALAQIEQGNHDSALEDLKLLRAMATQSLDKRIEESFSFIQIQEFRYLVFQAFLGAASPVPDAVYQEMLTSIGDTDQSLRRGLKRKMSRYVVHSVNELLEDSPNQRPRNFRETYQRMVERIIYQEHTPQCVARLEVQVNQAFDGSSGSQVAIPAMWNPNEAWLLSSGFSSDLWIATQVRTQQTTRLELVRAVRMLQHQREAKGRFLTQTEFLKGITSEEFTAAVTIEYLTLHNPATGKAEGAIVATPTHMNLNDYLGFYLGPAIFPILDARSPTLSIRKQQITNPWELAQIKNNPRRLKIPTPKASTKNPSPPMR